MGAAAALASREQGGGFSSTPNPASSTFTPYPSSPGSSGNATSRATESMNRLMAIVAGKEYGTEDLLGVVEEAGAWLKGPGCATALHR